MTLAHISDTHLGFRAYGRTNAQGFNQREADVMATFKACLNAIAERDPDIVIHSGDLFHVVRPSNATIVETYRTLASFQTKRKAKPLVIIGGNHDSPRTTDSGNILRLFGAIPGVELVTNAAEYVPIDALDMEVLAVPSNSIVSREKIEFAPSGKTKYSILTLHGMTRQALPDHFDLDIDETQHEKWTYVALGDYHVHQAYGTNACYAGSTDFTSTNIWEESRTPKGWIWFDMDSGKMEFVPVATRQVIDFPPIDAEGLTGEEIGERLNAAATWNEEDLPIVRQQVHNVHSDVRSKISQAIIREISRKTLNYRLVLNAPTAAKIGREAVTARTLEQSWGDHIETVQLPGGVTKEAMRDLGLNLLREVTERETRPVEA